MESGKVKIWHSIVTRFGLFFIGLIVLAIFLSGYLIYERASSIISVFSRERIAHTSALAEQSFYSLLSEVENDISIIAENDAVLSFAHEPATLKQNRIEDLFRSILKNKPNYFQIRYINISEDGKELIRLEKLRRRIVVTAKERLQSKSRRPYYIQALSMSFDEIHFSPISLNEEFGVISPPFIPTIRAVKLIPNSSNEPVGMVVINVDLREFYANLRSIMDSGIDIMLIDDGGQYLFAPDMNKCFSGQLANQENFSNDYKFPITHLPSDTSLIDNLHGPNNLKYLTELKPLTYSKDNKTIYFVCTLPESLAFASALEVKRFSFFVIPLVSILTLLLALVLLRLLALRIGSITQAIGSEMGNGQHQLDQSIKRKDELGVLARTFLKMKTQINNQLEQLNRSLIKEQKAIKEKDEFLQNMSHELRTPLNAILGLTQLIKKNKPKPGQEPIVDAIHRSAESLAGLMHDVLDHQKLMEGQVHLEFKPAKISQLLQDIHAGYQFEAMNKGLGFEIKINPALQNSWHQVDALRFTQIVTNLVINAIKFTDKGKISLGAKLDDNDAILIEVKDTGIGIKPENLLKIRERFYQEKQIHSTSEGFGLGLSIVKQLVDLFSGELSIDSKNGLGSIFSIKLPLQLVDQAPEMDVEKNSMLSVKDLEMPITILHIEDDEPARLLIQQFLQSPNVTLEQTNNWGYVTPYLSQHKPDLIISDLMLGSIDVSEELTSIKNESGIPILLLSAKEVSHMQSISDHCIQKPFDLDQLMDLVVVVLGQDQFEQPQLALSYAQYDNDAAKIKRFLELLISEFETYILRIDQSFSNQDETEWIAIRHKLVTHIRSLDLQKLDQTLSADISDLNKNKVLKLKMLLSYDLSFFRNELRLLK